MDRAEAAERGKHQQQQQQRQSSREDEKKDWETGNDSWKTIPRDEKSWQVYRNTMDIWETSNNTENDRNEKPPKYSTNPGMTRRQHQEQKEPRPSKEYTSHVANSDRENSKTREKRGKKIDQPRKGDYELARRTEKEHPQRYVGSVDDRSGETGRRKRDEDRREITKQNRPERIEDSDVDERDDEDEDEDANESRNGLDEENYGTSYKNNYDAKKYYNDRDEGNELRDEASRRYRQEESSSRNDEATKYENEKSESDTTSDDSEDTSTITIPETGRKVEHIAQKLEQTAQKYAREHSPPKFVERRRGTAPSDAPYNQEHRQDQQPRMSLEREDKAPPSYERTYENGNEGRSRNSQRYERGYTVERASDISSNNANGNKQQQQSRGNTSSTLVITSSVNGTYERTTFAKNPERKRNVTERASSGRRFDNRPRPPFEDAPERPTLPRTPVTPSYSRERRYSDKEEIYGETTPYPRQPVTTIEKERGYESNFETKLERSKVMEKVQQVAYRRPDEAPGGKNSRNETRSNRSPGANDPNNNTLKNERKNGLGRQTTTLGHLAQTGRAFDLDSKSPKLVKRTKSFWRFRRDSDVLEGMALWQHRSLVDIPKMLKRESNQGENEARDENSPRKTATPEGSPGSGKSIGKESRSSDNTITNEDVTPAGNNRRRKRYEDDREPRQDEPKPAERIHVPEKSDYYESDFPTPAERPKLAERSEYRMQREERSLFVGNVSRKAIIEKERKRSLEAKRNMVVAELKENNEAAKGDRRNKSYGDDDDGLIQGFSGTEASDEESTYSCIIVKDQAVTEKTLLPRTKLRRDSDREKNTCGPWYDLWGVDNSVAKKNK